MRMRARASVGLLVYHVRTSVRVCTLYRLARVCVGGTLLASSDVKGEERRESERASTGSCVCKNKCTAATYVSCAATYVSCVA